MLQNAAVNQIIKKYTKHIKGQYQWTVLELGFSQVSHPILSHPGTLTQNLGHTVPEYDTQQLSKPATTQNLTIISQNYDV
jgi:hypothetical protein